MLFPAKPLKEPYKTTKLSKQLTIRLYTPFPAGKPGKGFPTYIETSQLRVATKNPFQYKIMT